MPYPTVDPPTVHQNCVSQTDAHVFGQTTALPISKTRVAARLLGDRDLATDHVHGNRPPRVDESHRFLAYTSQVLLDICYHPEVVQSGQSLQNDQSRDPVSMIRIESHLHLLAQGEKFNSPHMENILNHH